MNGEGEKKPLAVIALGLGKPKKDDEDAADGGYDDDFESAAADAFPELKDDPDRMAAFKQCIELCCENMSKGGGTEEGTS